MHRSIFNRIAVQVGILVVMALPYAEAPGQVYAAHPEDMIGYKFPSADELARISITKLAQCVVERDRRKALAVLSIPVDDPSYRSGLIELSKFDCMPFAGEAHMSSAILRGALFAALYAKDFKRLKISLSEKPLSFAADVAGKESAIDLSYLALHDFADCVVRADPSAARALVVADPASPAETQALGAMGPNLNACMDKGRSLEFSKIMLIGLVAEALYREARNGEVIH